MGKNSAIEWTDHTWNPWRGCWKVSPGCRACYMYREQERYGRDPRAIVRAADRTFNKPLHWNKPAKVFTCSWSDWFLKDADEWRGDAWAIVRQTPHLTYQILTKRPENIAERLPADWGDGYENVWLGVSVESQEYEWRLRRLAAIPARVRFVSYEPALGPLRLEPWHFEYFQWLISGGESGYKEGIYQARPADLDWFRDIRDQCARRGMAYFHKQHGGARKVNGTWGGRELDGETWNKFPGDAPRRPNDARR